MIFEEMEIVANKSINGNYFILDIRSSKISGQASPGNFVMVRLSSPLTDPLLSRPFSIHYVSGDVFSLLIKRVGKTTGLLSGLLPGDTIKVLGPLGNSFMVAKTIKPVLIGGGVGVAPMKFLLHNLLKSEGFSEISVIIGGRTKGDIIDDEIYRQKRVKTIFTTDDGSLGLKGNVIDALNGNEAEGGSIYCCGPDPMMKAVAKFAKKRKIPCQVSLETRMACGIGVCLGCVVKTLSDSNSCVCTDGPVFDGAAIY